MSGRRVTPAASAAKAATAAAKASEGVASKDVAPEVPKISDQGDAVSDGVSALAEAISVAGQVAPVGIRIKASRPVYRRAGLVFGDQLWVEVDAASLTEDQSRALLADAVLTIQTRLMADDWKTLSAEERAEAIAFQDDDD